MSTKDSSNNNSGKITMEQLLASSVSHPVYYNRGDQVKGNIIQINDNELIIDIGAKTEGIIDIKEFNSDELSKLKVGEEIESFVAIPENKSGQIVLTTQKNINSRIPFEKLKKWNKYLNAQTQKSKLIGTVTELNKGGLIVDIDGIRGFLPTSQINFETLKSVGLKDGFESLIGTEIHVYVIEVKPESSRMILSTREEVSSELKDNLLKFKEGDSVKGKIVLIVPFGIFLDVNSLEGFIFSNELSWNKSEDLLKNYKIGQEIETFVLNTDLEIGRLNLSLKRLTDNPFDKLSDSFQIDDIVKGTITDINPSGVSVTLKDDVEGFIPASKMESSNNYKIGDSLTFLVDGIDKNRHKVNLAPFLTSTKGLLYK